MMKVSDRLGQREYSQVDSRGQQQRSQIIILAQKSPDYIRLIDFGAGTTDMTVFKLKKGGQKKADMIAARIIYKGFSDIENRINDAMNKESIVRQHYLAIIQ
jgi:hypothetical protein